MTEFHKNLKCAIIFLLVIAVSARVVFFTALFPKKLKPRRRRKAALMR